MKKPPLRAAACALCVCLACRKAPAPENLSTPVYPKPAFQEYVIAKGGHFAAGNTAKPVEITRLNFSVLFDSSAVYRASNPENQYDINKLYGFSDNGAHHHRFSARFGWRWSDGALWAFAYVYNGGQREWKKLGALHIGDTVRCGIAVQANHYLFTLNGRVDSMPRMSGGDTAVGYQLYPYFGGNEPAPHHIKIWIREEERSR